MKDTVQYYNENVDSYTADTVDRDMSDLYMRFLGRLNGKKILDMGCGSGRDTKAFLERGFDVDAMDASEAMCEYASEYTGIEVQNKTFLELEAEDAYDGIFACASLLHSTKEELPEVFQRIARALKTDGILYASFKYGDYEGMKNGRYFIYLTEKTILPYIHDNGLRLVDFWISEDVRPERSGEKWINIIAKRKNR